MMLKSIPWHRLFFCQFLSSFYSRFLDESDRGRFAFKAVRETPKRWMSLQMAGETVAATRGLDFSFFWYMVFTV